MKNKKVPYLLNEFSIGGIKLKQFEYIPTSDITDLIYFKMKKTSINY